MEKNKEMEECEDVFWILVAKILLFEFIVIWILWTIYAMKEIL